MRAAGGWAAAGGAAGGRMWAGGGRYGQEQGVRKPEAATTRSQKTRGKTIKQKKTVSAFGQPKYVLSEGGVAPKVFFSSVCAFGLGGGQISRVTLRHLIIIGAPTLNPRLWENMHQFCFGAYRRIGHRTHPIKYMKFHLHEFPNS